MTLSKDLTMGTLVCEPFQLVNRLPHTQVDDESRIVEQAVAERVTCVVLEPPNKAIGGLGETVDFVEALNKAPGDFTGRINRPSGNV